MIGPLQATPYTIPLLIVGATLIPVGAVIWRLVSSWGRSAAFLIWACSFWALTYAAELASASPVAMLRWDQIQFIGICCIPTCLLAYAARISGRDHLVTPRRIAITAALPFLVLIAVFTNDVHHLVWKSIGIQLVGTFSILVQTYGPLLYVFLAYMYASVGVAIVWIARSAKRRGSSRSTQRLVAILGLSAPLVVNAIEYAGLNPLGGLSLSPFSFAFTGLALFADGVVMRFGNLLPVSNAAAVQSIAAGIVTVDENGTVLSANPFARQILGWAHSSYLGRSITRALPGLPEWVAQNSEGRELENERYNSFQREDREFDVSVTTTVRRWQNNSYVLLFTETTEQRKSESALRGTEQRFDLLFDKAADAFFLLDSAGRVVRANQQAVWLTGLRSEELANRSFAYLGRPTANAEPPGPFLLRVALTGPIEMEFMKDQKAPSTVEVSIHEITMDTGPGFLAMAHDVSHRKEAEQELIYARDVAESASRAKSDFLAHMSHELRTPLNHITGFAGLLNDPRIGELNEVQRDYLADIQKSSRHLLELINDILDLAKVEAGKLELNPGNVELRELLESITKASRQRVRDRDIVVSLNCANTPDQISADQTRLTQVLTNLISNAEKFTKDGGQITIGSRLESGTSELVRISVADTGVGIEPGELESIFGVFEQAGAGRSAGGTGLGLPLSRRLVELHGGRIWAESNGPGTGSTFTFVIPTAQAPHDTES